MHYIILGAGTAGLISALMIREKYPLATIDIIKSGEIGIIGVGEGSTEHWNKFINFIGLDYFELIHKTKATIKIGILFKEWNKGTEYVHSVGDFNLSTLDRPEIYNHMIINCGNKRFPLAPHFENTFYKNNVVLSDNLKTSNQYHFDTFCLNNYLQEICTQRNIQIIDCTITSILQNESGYVTGLRSEDREFTGDFFIDCSGFKRLLSTKVGNEWVSKSEYLPMNHAIAFPTDLETPDNIEPYTTTTALSSGWVWKIPTQDRYGNGYVFNDNYITSDQAVFEAGKHLNKDIEKAARDIKFSAGRVDKFWNKNVVSVGLSGSFAEPLEAQSIGFTIVQMFALLDYLDQWPIKHNVNNHYNERMNKCFDNIIDYLQAHYITKRDDTKFWKDKPFKLTDFNHENIPLMEQGIIIPSLFDGKDNMFTTANWYQVIDGVGLLNRNCIKDNMNNNRFAYNNSNLKQSIEICNKSSQTIISHRNLLNIINFNYLQNQ